MKARNILTYSLLLLFIVMPVLVEGGNIANTKHNLSITGPGPVKSTTEDRICVFCHAPDRSKSRHRYLWNRELSRAYYTPYQSSTLYARVGQPTGTSKLCLSCHDGTIAMEKLFTVKDKIPFKGGIRYIPWRSKIGTVLADDHPVSFLYDNSLAARNGELAYPGYLPRQIKLDSGNQLQCTSCHDPHENKYGNFLVMSNAYSNLCKGCHRQSGWTSSAHATSNRTWNGLPPDPWPDTWYYSVGMNGCQNCHRPHRAAKNQRLLTYYYEEDVCLVCHNGNASEHDIEEELAKPYIHAVQDYVDIHDPTETNIIKNLKKQKHVECVDCHNPHKSSIAESPEPPLVSGASLGVSGVDLAGQHVNEAVYQYEICFKCHADNNMITEVSIDRVLQQLNTRLEFDPVNPSFHPVISQGVNSNVPSLLEEYSAASIIFCTDCHGNDSETGPAGPHGSLNRFMLIGNYTTNDFTEESSYNYELCYKCHERTSILNNESFSEHNSHIVEQRTPCSACHDAHGVSALQGNPVNNSNLINFDLEIVSPNSQGQIFFEDTGLFSGSCSLSCHGVDHESTLYPPTE